MRLGGLIGHRSPACAAADQNEEDHRECPAPGHVGGDKQRRCQRLLYSRRERIAAALSYHARHRAYRLTRPRKSEDSPMCAIRQALALVTVSLVALGLLAGTAHAQKKTLVIALNQDPDILDPTLARTYVGRIVFSHICEKLYEIDESLRISPQLAAELPAITDGGRTVTIKLRPGVKFNDGTAMDAGAVKFSLDRHRTLKGSNRASELAPVEAVEVVDPHAIRLRLKAPFSPLLAQLTDRAGMPVSPTAVNKLGEKFGTAPVCVGPWQFAERVAQDRIVVEKSTHYFDPGQAKFDKIIFRIIPDDNVRLANLKSGDIDVLHRLSPTDATAIKREGRFELSNVTGLGYDGITINLRNKTGKLNPPGDLGTPLANDPRVREALELSIDREALNQVAWDGLYTPGCTPIPPISVFFDKSRKCPTRDVTRAKKLLADAGLAGGYAFEMTVVNNPRERRVAEVIQQMAREVGFNISLRAQEFASALTDTKTASIRRSRSAGAAASIPTATS